MARVFVGMSGGVDSSVAAALLVEQGHKVTGVYMKNWSEDLPGMRCPWAEDLADAKRVAVNLGIDFKVFDFENDYREKVVKYMLEEYQLGRTPNPDIMCNQEVKFKLFLDAAFEQGADMIATGHYARTSEGRLYRATDPAKDQTYFLYRVNREALAKTLFPLGDLTKPEVRAIAKDRNLATATKKESMGVCFVGEVGMRDFLKKYVEVQPGDIIDKQNDKLLGHHEGAIFYTIGQRHGLNIGGGLPYYVVAKDMSRNVVYVSTNLNDQAIWRENFEINNLHWIDQAPLDASGLTVRLRHRGNILSVAKLDLQENRASVEIDGSERAITSGQSAVFYKDDLVVGGGIIV